jgi:uncharacterized protein (DUF362 family)
MSKYKVAAARYEKPGESVRKVVELCEGLKDAPAKDKFFVKPNIVFWTRSAPLPPWGVITTSRVVHDAVLLLKEHGVDDITIGEGMVLFDTKDAETPAHAFETLGYSELKKRYGCKLVNIYERPFSKVDLGDGVELDFNVDFLASDFVVNLPVMKTHAQTVVSLGIKNVKGMINVNSRKKCHSADPEKDLHYMVAKLAHALPPSLTILDGIYTSERGPGFDGRMRRSNILVASRDVLSADMVGAKLLGYEPSQAPHLVHVANRRGRPTDLSDIEVVGEPIEDLASPHEYTFPYTEDGSLPIPMAKMGIKGLSYRKFDATMCTYCSAMTGAILMSIAMAWKGAAWDNVEVLTGKVMQPDPAKNTVLIGKCLYEAHKRHPNIENMAVVKTCPPTNEAVVEALHRVGVDISPAILENLDKAPAFFMRKYEGKPEFDESLFRVI